MTRAETISENEQEDSEDSFEMTVDKQFKVVQPKVAASTEETPAPEKKVRIQDDFIDEFKVIQQ